MWGRAPSELSERRRARRRSGRIIFFILLLTMLAAVLYGLNRPHVRIANITAIGLPESASVNARDSMNGSYLGIIPRDSIFFFPENKIRSDILSSDGSIAAVSIKRNNLTGITIKADIRFPIARWCGLSPTAGVDEYCYVFDANGLIFSPDETTGSTTSPQAIQTINAFALYAPLVGDTPEPLLATLADADKIPSVFDFARQLATFGSPADKVVIEKNGEVTIHLMNGTRIVYVIGHEQNAYTALVSASDNLNLQQGNIEYVDLRFDGKVYLKKK